MIRIPLPDAATQRRLACLAAASLALALSACSPPPHAAVVKCAGSNVADYDVEKDCTVTVQRFDRPTTATIRTDTRKRHAVAAGHFTVDQGTVRIELRSGAGTVAEAVASPGTPGSVEGRLRLRRQNSGFHVRFHPEGEVAGLKGSVHFQTR